MKKLILPILLFVFTAPVFAQVQTEDVAIIQSLFGKEKKELMKAYLNLSEADAAKFWPIYEAYELERKELGKQRILNISDYVNTYGTADDAKIDELTLNNIKINTATDKLIGKYYGKVKKAIGAKNAAKFYQLENYLLIAVKESIWDNIPFIDELDNK